jgi:hypothetical protein
LGNLIPTVREKTTGILGRNRRERGADGVIERVVGAGLGFAPRLLQFGEGGLNGREVRRIAGQKPDLTLTSSNELCDPCAVMDAQIIHDHELSRTQRRRENLFDVGFEGEPIGSTRNEQGRANPRKGQGGNESRVRWRVARHIAHRPLSARSPRVARREIQVAAAFVNDDDILRRDAG